MHIRHIVITMPSRRAANADIQPFVQSLDLPWPFMYNYGPQSTQKRGQHKTSH